MKTCNLFCSSKKIVILIIVFLIIFSSLTAASFKSMPKIGVLDEFLKNTVTLYKIPGLAVAIVSDNEILHTFSHGKTSSGAKIGSNTPFLLGSTTKMFTALAVMRLVEQGKVELDYPVKKYLPEFRLKIPSYDDQITVRHLLNHTSGLSNKGMPVMTMGEESLQEELESLSQCTPDFPPGERYAYFNTNYRLLGLIIERVSGLKYGEFLHEEIFKPLLMITTFAGPEGVNELAPGHGQFFGYPFQRQQIFRPGALPSGYLVSGVSDIARFLIAELRSISGDSILNPNTIQTTWTPPEDAKEGYGMGWLITNGSANERILIHGGALENYQSFFCLIPQRKIGFVFLMNQGGLLPMLSFNAIRDGLLKMVTGEQPKIETPRWPIIVVSGIFLFLIVIEILRVIRLRTWIIRIARKKLWRRWLNIVFELIYPSFLLFGLNPLMNNLMGDKVNWTTIYSLFPELFFFLVLSICLGFFRGLFKIWLLMKSLQSEKTVLFHHK